METVIRAQSLRKAYGATVAVEDVSFEVRRGEIFGVVGPNGAGKTTTIECLTGMRSPDSGKVEVLGLDPVKGGDGLRRRIGVQLQQAALPDRLKVREALALYSSFYDSPADWRGLMERWGLKDKQETVFSDLSGGQQQRLFVALALLNDPEVVFLDELTSGLDPQARRASWDLVRGVRNAGKTVMLVTHFMDEAEALCDHVAVVDRGELVALDTPEALIHFTVVGEADDEAEAIRLASRLEPDLILMDLRMPGTNGVAAIEELSAAGSKANVLVLTTYDSDADILRAIEAGATGYLLKDARREDLYTAVRSAASGRSALAPTVADSLVRNLRKPEQQSLSKREVEVLELVRLGKSNKQVARSLHVSEATVKTHLIHAFGKLGVDDRTAAVSAALERGILRLE